jgi:hypothetical protein
VALIPAFDKTKGLACNLAKTVGCTLAMHAFQSDLEESGSKGRGSKRLRKQDGENNVDEIDMITVGSLEEYRRAQ